MTPNQVVRVDYGLPSRLLPRLSRHQRPRQSVLLQSSITALTGEVSAPVVEV
ncbi:MULTISPECIES: hypothetical protein [unclassified Kitasatospora]|uniref:hypothetical protein n=1 Tax=unclassified Kitasatospora TaxID=2633591 RepID=UPI000AF9A1C9|nr:MULTISPECIES: hypothetical protein [unclassified Kitasatospora]